MANEIRLETEPETKRSKSRICKILLKFNGHTFRVAHLFGFKSAQIGLTSDYGHAEIDVELGQRVVVDHIPYTVQLIRPDDTLQIQLVRVPRGLRVAVYRDATFEARGIDCTMNGLTRRFNELTLIGEGVEGPFEPLADAPAVELGRIGNHVHAKPAGEKRWTMAGGNFIYTCDSRFSCLNNGSPISVHDRIEG